MQNQSHDQKSNIIQAEPAINDGSKGSSSQPSIIILDKPSDQGCSSCSKRIHGSDGVSVCNMETCKSVYCPACAKELASPSTQKKGKIGCPRCTTAASDKIEMNKQPSTSEPKLVITESKLAAKPEVEATEHSGKSTGKGNIIISIPYNNPPRTAGKPVRMTLRSQTLPLSAQRAAPMNLRCHYCRNKDKTVNHLLCSNYPQCKSAFCFPCLKKYFKITPTKPAFDYWVCLVCTGQCGCTRCQGRIREELNKIEGPEGQDCITPATLVVNEWRKEPYLCNETRFKGPKTYKRWPVATAKRQRKSRKILRSDSLEEDGSSYVPNPRDQKTSGQGFKRALYHEQRYRTSSKKYHKEDAESGSIQKISASGQPVIERPKRASEQCSNKVQAESLMPRGPPITTYRSPNPDVFRQHYPSLGPMVGTGGDNGSKFTYFPHGGFTDLSPNFPYSPSARPPTYVPYAPTPNDPIYSMVDMPQIMMPYSPYDPYMNPPGSEYYGMYTNPVWAQQQPYPPHMLNYSGENFTGSFPAPARGINELFPEKKTNS